jgi:hypothetical protein
MMNEQSVQSVSSMFFVKTATHFFGCSRNNFVLKQKSFHFFPRFLTHSDCQRKTYLIVGLGNPGVEYEQTRHNVGFLALNKICKHYHFEWSSRTQFDSIFCGVWLLFIKSFPSLSTTSIEMKNF